MAERRAAWRLLSAATRCVAAVALGQLSLACGDSPTPGPVVVVEDVGSEQTDPGPPVPDIPPEPDLPPVNTPPELEAIAAQVVVEGAPLAFKVRATDADGDAVSLGASGLPDTASFDAASGIVEWTPGYDLVTVDEGSVELSWTFEATDDGVPAPETTSIEVLVTVINDEDADGIADPDDADIDGDLILNDDEPALGTDPHKADTDDDGASDSLDVCPTTADPEQPDADADGAGDACDPCPFDPLDDVDTDGVCGDLDLCPEEPDPEQLDTDDDTLGDACDACPEDPTNDADGDGICGVAPALDGGPDAVVAEGATLLRALTVVDPDSAGWTATADYGLGEGPVPVEVSADGALVVSTVYPDDGEHTIIIEVADLTGAAGAAAFGVIVENVAPSLDVGAPVALVEGGVLLRVLGVTDPGADTHTATVDYELGDGPEVLDVTADGGFVLARSYPDAGGFAIQVEVLDDDGGVATATLEVEVAPAPPAVTVGEDVTLTEGATFSRIASFTDPGNGPFVGSVDWGDGSEVEAVEVTPERTIALEHVFADDGLYTVTLTITDEDDEAGEASLAVTVENVAPEVVLGPNQLLAEGTPLDAAGEASDPGADTLSATVDYGAGAGPLPLPIGGSGALTLSTTYADDGIYTVTVTVTDDDGGVGTASLGVTVSAGEIAVDPGPGATIDEGGVFSGAGSYASAGGGPFTAQVDYGEGTGPEPLALLADGTFALEHTYADDSEYVVLVSVSDEDLHVGAATTTVVVLGVPPAVEVIAPLSGLEGGATTGQITVTDVGADAIAVVVDWGDGGDPEPVAAGPAGAVPLSHVYADDGEVVVTVTATDDDGLSTVVTMLGQVANVAPTVTAGPPGTLAEGEQYVGVGSVSDPGDDVVVVTADWGDGSEPATLEVDAEGGFVLEHVYGNDGSYLIVVVATDDDLQSTAVTIPVSVGDVGIVVDAGLDATATEGAPFQQSGGFTDPGADSWTATVDYGAGDGPVPLPLAADKSFALDHVYADDGEYVVTVVVIDAGDGTQGADALVVTVANEDPIVVASEPAAATEGSPIALSAQVSDAGALDTHAILVDWGDGGAPEAVALGEDGAVEASHVYPDDGTYLIGLVVTDDDGGLGASSVTAVVENAAPTLEGLPDATIPEGAQYEASVGFDDPGADEHSATVDWGDGSPPEAALIDAGTVALAHVYADDGVHWVVVTVTDDDGGVGENSHQIVVENVPPTVDAGLDATLAEGEALSRDGAATDPGADPLGGYVDWGDGQAPEAVAVADDGSFALLHVWPAAGEYTVLVTIEDGDGGVGSAGFVVTVENATPTLELAAPGVADEAETWVLAGTITDPGDAAWQVAVAWGDEQSTDLQVSSEDGGGFELAHAFATPGQYTAIVTVTDDDGATAAAQRTVAVSAVAPVVTLNEESLQAPEGSEVTIGGGFADPGLGPWTATADFGDGSLPQALTLADDNTFTASRAYPIDGEYSVTVLVIDESGEAGSATATVTISNVAPVAMLVTPEPSPEGSLVMLEATFSDPGADVWSATVDWGDGAGPVPATVGGEDGHSVDLSHTWADDGEYGVVLTVTDDDAETGSTSVTVVVTNVAPTIAAGDGATLPEGATLERLITVTDPGADVVAATVDLGTGGGPQPLALGADGSAILTATYDDDGTFDVVVTATDDDGGESSASFLVTVVNAPPVVTLNVQAVADVGAPLLVGGLFTDPGADTHTATIDLDLGGDPEPLELGADGSFEREVTYNALGERTITVVVTDDDGGSTAVSASVSVVNVAPVVDAGADVFLDEGSELELVATFTDPVDTGHTATVAWGEPGGAPVEVAIDPESSSLTATHSWPDDGLFLVTAAVTDPHGAVGTDTVNVSVTNVAPIVDAGADVVIGDDGLLTRTGSFTDPGADTHTATVSWGDGGPPEELALTDGTFDLLHVYAISGEYVVVVTVVDDDGGVGTAAFQVRSCKLPAGATRRWVGGSTKFETASSWLPAAVPGSGDVIYICGASTVLPKLTANRTLRGVITDDGVHLSTGGKQLTINQTLAGKVAGGGSVRFTGAVAARGQTPTAVIDGTVTQSGDLVVAGNMTINAGRWWNTGGRKVKITGALTVVVNNNTSHGLRMFGPADETAVLGNVLFSQADYQGNGTSANSLKGGVLRIGGNLTQDTGYASSGKSLQPTGTQIVFDGQSKQTVTFWSPGTSTSYLRHVVVANPAGVHFATNVYVLGQLEMAEGAVLTQATNKSTWYSNALPQTGAGYNIKANRIAGSLIMDADATLPNGGHLYIDGNQSLTVNGKTLLIAGSLVQTLGNSASYGLKMADPADLVSVRGNATFKIPDYHGNASTQGRLTGGTLAIGGNFTETNGYASSGRAFISTGTTVLFDGTGAQTVSFQSPGTSKSRFHHVEVSNAAGATFSTNVYVTGTLTMLGAGKLVQASNRGTYYTKDLPNGTQGYRVARSFVQGHLTLSQPRAMPHSSNGLYVPGGSSLTFNGQQLEVGGALSVTFNNATNPIGLMMTQAGDTLIVGGSASFHAPDYISKPDSAVGLKAGVIHIRGNFSQSTGYASSTKTFRSAGTQVVFDGTKAQSVSFGTPATGGSRFWDVQIANPAGVTFATNLVVGGELQLSDGGVVKQSGSYNTHLQTRLPETTSGYQIVRTRVAGNITLDAPRTIPNGGHLYVDPGRKLDIGGHALVVTGALVVQPSNTAGDGLHMHHAYDDVTVHGIAYFQSGDYQGSTTTSGNLTAGTLRLRGGFQQKTGYATPGAQFVSTGTTVFFEGGGAQSVSFQNAGTSSFRDVRVRTTGGVTFTSNVYVTGRLTVEDGGKVTQSCCGTWYTTRLPDVISGTYAVVTSRVGGTVVVDTPVKLPQGNNSLIVDSGRKLILNGSKVEIGGNLTVQEHPSSGRGLIMHHPFDEVVVNGSATFMAADYTQGDSGPDLATGTLRVRKNFTQKTGYASTTRTFSSTGTRVVFDGTTAQSVSFQNAGNSASHFRDVEVSNPAGVTFASNVFVRGTLQMIGGGKLIQGSGQGTYYAADLPITSSGYQVSNTRTAGHVKLSADRALPLTSNVLRIDPNTSLTPNGHTVTLGGALVVRLGNSTSGLYMKNTNDVVIVGGNATFTAPDYTGSATQSGKLTKGRIHFRGNVTQTTGYASGQATLVSNGTVAVFDGTKAQTVSFAHMGKSYLHGVEFANPAGTTLAQNFTAKGPLSSPAGTYGIVTSSGKTLTVVGMSGANLRVHNTRIVSNGGTVGDLADTSFTGFGATVTPVTLSTTACDATWSNLTFHTVPTSGRYLKATDTNGAETLARITVVDSKPGYHLGKVSKSGGFVIVWGTTSSDGDGDGLPDQAEVETYGTNPVKADTDGDGFKDGAEIALGTDPKAAASSPLAFPTSVTLATGTSPVALAAADLNGDDALDVAAADEAADTVLVVLQDPATPGSFLPAISLAVGDAPVDVTLADADGDGVPDILTANHGSDDVTIRRQSPTTPGTFPDELALTVSTGPAPTAVAAIDADGDGVVDLVIALEGADAVAVLRQDLNSTGTYLPALTLPLPAGAAPSDLAAVDLDGDDVAELVATAAGTDQLALFHRAAAEPLAYSEPALVDVGAAPSALAVSNLNGDQLLDLATADAGDGTVTLILQSQLEPGTFIVWSAFTAAAGPAGLAAGPLDDKGIADLAVAALDADRITVLLSDASDPDTRWSTALQTATGDGEAAVALADLNADGALDLIVANSASGTVVVYLQ